MKPETIKWLYTYFEELGMYDELDDLYEYDQYLYEVMIDLRNTLEEQELELEDFVGSMNAR